VPEVARSFDGPRARVRAYAKLNLWLRILGTRPDGYHEIETVFSTVSLGDDVEAILTTEPGVRVEMRAADGLVGVLPSGTDNTLTMAARHLDDRTGAGRPTLVRVIKRIAIGAGLAGGSADAAGALVALGDLWDTGLSRSELAEIGLKVGMDVPYCLTGGTALATARGERLTPLAARGAMWFVLGMARYPLYSKAVYDTWDRLEATSGPRVGPMVDALEAGDVRVVASLLHNDLERAALAMRPGLAADKQRLLDAGALGASLSGSGPTIFGLAADEAHAASIAEAVAGDFAAVVVVASLPRSIEPLG